jgi:hypothetical protein
MVRAAFSDSAVDGMCEAGVSAEANHAGSALFSRLGSSVCRAVINYQDFIDGCGLLIERIEKLH